jgi:thiol-disulfide isomerase/thioredoxin
MKHVFTLLIVLLVACKTETKNEAAKSQKTVVENPATDNIKLAIFDYNGLEPYLNKTDDKTHVVNFWATWCAPCVKELPHFEALNKNYKDKDVEVMLVSLDFPNQYEKKLKPFIKKHDLQSEILVLDDVDQNTWIPKIDKDWDGAIPVTIIYNKDKREFYDRPFTYEELETEVEKFLN